MFYKYANNCVSRITANVLSTDTSFTVQNGAIYPATPFCVIVANEVMKCTNVSGNILTVVRAQQGSVAAAYGIGERAMAAFTVDDVNHIQRLYYLNYTDRVSPGVDGRVAWFFDNGIICYDNGIAWKSQRRCQNIVEFNDTTFTWLNQGSATLTVDRGQSAIVIPASTVNNVRGRITPVASNYVLRTLLTIHLNTNAGQLAGILLHDTSSGKCILFGYNASNNLIVNKFSAVNTFDSSYPNYALKSGMLGGNGMSLGIRDDGTNRYYDYSIDHCHWDNYLTTARTDYFTPDRIGYGGNDTNNYAYTLIMHSWDKQ